MRAVVGEPAGPDRGPAAGSDPEAVLAALDPEQRQVALAVTGPVCVLAGAGTGKTRAVAHRIAYAALTGVVDPAHVLAVTFTTRAAGEMRARLVQLAGSGGGLERVQARTFHSAALRQLTHFWPATVGGRPPAVLDSKVSLLAEAARGLRVSAGVAELRDVASEIEWAKVSQVRPDGYAGSSAKAGRTPPLAVEVVARLYARYEDLCRERHLVDFESVLELTAAILAEHGQAAAEVRDRYRYFVIDEYQDVNPLQKLLLDSWAGDRDDVCVVGDPRQTIYSFAGATATFLSGFAAEFPDATVIELVRNYRSTPQVIALANQLTGVAGPRSLADQLRAGGPLRPGGRATPPRRRRWSRSARRARPRSSPSTRTRRRRHRRWLRGRTRCALQGWRRARWRCWSGPTPRPWRSSGRWPSGECPARCGGRTGSSTGPRYGRRPDCCARRRNQCRPPPAASRRRRSGTSWPGWDSPGTRRRAAVPPGSAGSPWRPWPSWPPITSRPTRMPPWADSSTELGRRSAIEHAPAIQGVTLASLHAAKGLEWDVVFLPGLTEGTLPIVYAQTEEAIEEERRLLYVGVTRARERIFLSWSLSRSPGGRRTRKPSRFLGSLRRR